MGCEPLADLKHRGANPESIHEYENSWPRPAAGRAIEIARAGPIIGLNLDLVHEHVLAHDAEPAPRACLGLFVAAESLRHREQWKNKIPHAGVRRRAELYDQQLDGLQTLRHTVRGEFLAESRKQQAVNVLRQIPFIGPLRAAQLVALIQTPYRFRSKRRCGPIVAWQE